MSRDGVGPEPATRHGLALVTGAGGFIGGHLVARLLADGWRVRAVDHKPLELWQQVHTGSENLRLDLRRRGDCLSAAAGTDQVYNLACDMGGVEFIEQHRALCMLSVLINTHLIEAAREMGVERYFFSSSACVYAAGRQDSTDAAPLRETDAYPAMPEDGYGWEKLFSERICRHFSEDFGLETRVARYHNVYGPYETWRGGREKAPAAICRKVAEAVCRGLRAIDIWGDGRQTRSFTYIDDCIEGTVRLMASDCREPLNVGSAEVVTIDQLVDLVEAIAGIQLERRYDTSAPQGVRGRSSDNALVLERLEWEPGTPLMMGIERTYKWIYDQVRAGERDATPAAAAWAADGIWR